MIKLQFSQYFKEETFPFWIQTMKHDYQNAPQIHCHDFIEMVYVINGNAKHYFEGQFHPINKGDVLIINPGEQHTFRIAKGEQIEIINCLFLPDLIEDSYLKKLGISQSMDFTFMRPLLDKKTPFHNRVSLKGGYLDRIPTLLKNMLEEYNNGSSGFSTLIRLQLVEVLILLSRVYKEKEITHSIHSPKNNERTLLVNKICSYLETHYDQKISTNLLCELFNISARHLNRVFKQETGLTVIEMVQKIRIEKAKHLLSKTDEKVINVAIKVGYDDPAFFTRLFRRKVGCSPGRYKTSNEGPLCEPAVQNQ